MTVPTDKLYSVKEMIAFNILEAKNEISKLAAFSLLLESKKGTVTGKNEAYLLQTQIKQNKKAIEANLSDIERYMKIHSEIDENGNKIAVAQSEEKNTQA